jgi:2-dehydropantoate 2-reductase
MAVTIVGAGAIGGVTGASLTRAGHDVLLVDQAADHVKAMKTKTGIWRDLVVRKRKTEVEAHLGATLERAARHGLTLPLTHRLLELIGEIEAGRRPMAWTNLDELVGVGR